MHKIKYIRFQVTTSQQRHKSKSVIQKIQLITTP